MKVAAPLTHDECIYLLAAYVNAQLSEVEVTAVAAHLEHCRQCGEDLQIARSLQRYFSQDRHSAEQEKIFATLRTPASKQANFERLWQRIETQSAPPLRTHPRWLLPLSAAAVLMLAVALQWSVPWRPAAYRTLANVAERSACGQLRVRFSDVLQPLELQQLLRAVGADIVNGPSEHGVYTLSAKTPATVLQQLRLHPGVLLAEPTSC
jgi:anti-sigma factor RsiW